ncbi:MAG: S8 family serine peptidase [Chlorobi bacterium]|nr:S8 family serine peptidase [Chlorobiota bacterium]
MIETKKMTAFFLAAFFAVTFSIWGTGYSGDEYLANEIIVKFSPNAKSNGEIKTEALKSIDFIGITDVKPLFPNEIKEKSFGDLNNIYKINYAAPYDPKYLSLKISNSKNILWSEPHFIRKIALDVDDPKYVDGTQWHLTTIHAAEAWDISQGSADVVVAIVDTGVSWEHEDLAGNVWTNANEIPDNGVDDDGNGYIDDVHGWDFGDNDNDPKEDAPVHGTHVAGIACAVTNNAIGIASIGFNTKFMPIKVTSGSSGSFAFPFEAIQYAADNGADVINFSWRGLSYSRAEQELMDYCTGKGSAIVAAAGNDRSPDPAYPASYKNVLSVAATQNGDTRWSATNYGITIDVAAPGASIYSTWSPDAYLSLNGTSMASPLTAGLAALVKSAFPDLTPLQILERVRVTTDNIDDLNPGRELMLGSGRINALTALTAENPISVRETSAVFHDLGNGNGIFEPGETVAIEMEFTNYLAAISAFNASLVIDDENATVLNGDFSHGAAATLESFDNSNNQLTFKISSDVPENTNINLLLEYNDGKAYSDFQWLSIRVNPTFDTQAGNDVALTINGTGALGFNDYGETPVEGDGFRYQDGKNLLFEGGFLYGNSSAKVMDALHIQYLTNRSSDFKNQVPFTIQIPGDVSDQQGKTIFTDEGAGIGKMQIQTELNSFSFSDVPNEKFITLRYTLRNYSDSLNYHNVFVGVFFDFDINSYDWEGDIVGYDADNNYGFAYDEDGDPETTVVGAALVSSDNYGFYAFDNNGDNGSIKLNDTFTDAEKWAALSGGVSRTEAGPNDISLMVSSGPYTFEAGSRIDVAFALGAADNLDQLKEVMLQAREKYGDIPVGIRREETDFLPKEFVLSQNYPNPFSKGTGGNPSTTIKYSIPSLEADNFAPMNVTLKIFDVLGREVATLVNAKQTAGKYVVNFDASRLAAGMYIYRLQAGIFTQSKKMILLK